ncbi:hypothetical protein BDL97_14G071100 [Sphagnum fallax]|nr:hypothetical protein BDL97_14G071100 [Sphagnum fallax]
MAMLPMQTSPDVGGGDFGSMTLGRRSKKEERIPQWGYQETKEFIAVRAELEKDFSQTKRNKTLWQLIAGKMKEKGFHRSADQCKCKWKNLVNRYKGKESFEPDYEGKETSEHDNGKQCPFFEELDVIFKERAKSMDRMLHEVEAGARPVERREQEWRIREQEWRDAMEKLEQERITREQGWREREEQRRAREEVRAQKRDELFAALLSKLAQEDDY